MAAVDMLKVLLGSVPTLVVVIAGLLAVAADAGGRLGSARGIAMAGLVVLLVGALVPSVTQILLIRAGVPFAWLGIHGLAWNVVHAVGLACLVAAVLRGRSAPAPGYPGTV